ncbi:MAG TPA: right-handed parallel beta-helix repeat-containing protein [Geminicoccaceae bacterium]|nr:right-handed parallel beta-helix repeat-containing protein [Geminicoccaceae bacterium]
MRLFSLAMPAAIVLSTLAVAPAAAQEALRFDSCAALRRHVDTRRPNEHVLLAPAVYECREPVNPSVDGLTVDFGGSLLRVADQALRPAIVIGDLHAPVQRRSRGVRVLNVKVDGNRAQQAYECWGGSCDPALNDSPYRQQRVNGITVNGCDDCALINAEVTGARSGGVVVVGSRNLLIDGLLAEHSHFDGLAGYWTYDSTFRNVRVNNNDYSGFSFDLDFSGNRIERFEASGNHDHGLFLRHARGNVFAHGTFNANGRNGVYLDRAERERADTCARQTRFEGVTIRGSGLHGAWLNFACEGNGFVASYLIDNHEGCYGGRNAELIGRGEHTACTGSKPTTVVDAQPTGDS